MKIHTHLQEFTDGIQSRVNEMLVMILDHAFWLTLRGRSVVSLRPRQLGGAPSRSGGTNAVTQAEVRRPKKDLSSMDPIQHSRNAIRAGYR